MLFINFRVGDGENKAAWLDAELRAVFGSDRVFRSSRSIDLGHNFEPPLWGAVENCSAMIAVIGERWMNDEFRHRLFQPNDVVRNEIAKALHAGKPVIPILEHAGRMHPASELPPDLAELAKCQYIRLTYRDGHTIPGLVERLVEAAPELGIGFVKGIKDLAKWNREHASLTDLPTELIVLGRNDIVEQMLAWLKRPAESPLIIQGQTTDEVAAFVAAVLNSHTPNHRAVLVSAKTGWEHTAKIPPSFPAVVVSDNDVPVPRTQNARHVIVARDWLAHQPDALILPRVPRDKAREAFLARGLPPHMADEYAGLFRRSHRALIRRLSPNGARPSWTDPSKLDFAVPLALVSRWSMSNPADHDVIARITNRNYSEIERFVSSSAVSRDPLVHRSGSRWQLADPYDASSQLLPQVSITDIRRFTEAAIEVLSEVDPVLSLPNREVPSARINGVSRTWSDEIRQGLAHGLARLSDAGTVTIAGTTAANHAAHIVRQVFKNADDDQTGLLWRSLHDVLPLLAEAAPRIFLDAVNEGLRSESPLLQIMFEDTGRPNLGRHSAHTGLLWSLETITWAPEHATIAILLIARLAEIDPGGSLSNRPLSSLASILTYRWPGPIPLIQQTTILNLVRRQHEEVGWRLLNDLTGPSGFLMPPACPQVRHDWIGSKSTSSDTVEWYQEKILSSLLADITAVPHRWVEFLPRIVNFPPAHRSRLLFALENTDFAALEQGKTRELWDLGCRIVNQERRNGDEPQHLSREDLDQLSSFLTTIEPVSDPTRHSWLFTWFPSLPDIELTDIHAHHIAVEARRREAVTTELGRHGVNGLARLAEASALGEYVGRILAEVAGDSIRDEIIARLGEPLATGWVGFRSQESGQDWVTDMANYLPHDPGSRTAFLLALPVDWAFERLALETPDVIELFWTQTPAFPFPRERAEEYLDELRRRGRTEEVIDALSIATHEDTPARQPPAGLITAGLRSLLNASTRVTSHTKYAVGVLLNYLHATGHSLREVAMWEIAFASWFHSRQPRALLNLIADNAEAFVELHQFRYLPTEEVNPEAVGFFMTGLYLRCLPGQTSDGVDRTHLIRWILQARALLDELGMRSSGDRAIGELISAGPDGEDGTWPTETVRDILDLEDADEIRNGFRTGLINNIGPTSRGLYDGGNQERESAAKYLAWSNEVEINWPYTAQVLRDHAKSLQDLGERWDRRAENDHDE